MTLEELSRSIRRLETKLDCLMAAGVQGGSRSAERDRHAGPRSGIDQVGQYLNEDTTGNWAPLALDEEIRQVGTSFSINMGFWQKMHIVNDY